MRKDNSHEDLDIEAFAKSMGLPSIPSSRALKKFMKKNSHFKKQDKNQEKEEDNSDLFIPLTLPKSLTEIVSNGEQSQSETRFNPLQDLAKTWVK